MKWWRSDGGFEHVKRGLRELALGSQRYMSSMGLSLEPVGDAAHLDAGARRYPGRALRIVECAMRHTVGALRVGVVGLENQYLLGPHIESNAQRRPGLWRNSSASKEKATAPF